MGLFDKKYCDICTEKIGLLGNRKLEDGNLCKNCAGKLSPFFDDRRNSTVDEIKEQLSYREENKQKVAQFNPTKVIGGRNLICVDEDNQKWLFSRTRKWKDNNPDIIDFSQVTGCDIDIDEHRYEIYKNDKPGERVSYNPPRYRKSYDFDITIYVNSPWFDDIKFKLNDDDIDSTYSHEYKEAQRDAEEIKSTLMGLREQFREEVAAANAPKVAVTCPNCSATTKPDASGCCEFCGGAC